MSESKFNVGDRVRSKFYNIVGTVIDVDADGYIINPDHLEEMWIGEDDAEAYDRKTDFLTRLSELMREFDAKIDTRIAMDKDYCEVARLSFVIGNTEKATKEELLYYKECLTADDLMNYHKE